MLALVQDSAETLVSSYVQPGNVVGDRRGQWSARSGVPDALVRAMVVIEGLELAQRTKQVPLIPDQGPIEKLTAAGQHPPFRDRVHSRHPNSGEHDLDARVGQDGVKQPWILACGYRKPCHRMRPAGTHG